MSKGQTNEPLINDIRNNIDSKILTASKSNFNIPQDKLNDALARFETTKQVIKGEIYQPLFNEFNNGSHAPDELRMGIIKAIKKTLDPDNKLSLQYGYLIEKEDLDIENNPQKERVTNWIQAIYAYQENKQKEIPRINVIGYLIPSGLTNKPLKNDIRDKIDSKFKNTTPDHFDEVPRLDIQVNNR